MATFTVTTLVDENDNGATTTINFGLGGSSEVPAGPRVSLREAVNMANANGGDDTIVFANNLSGLIRLTNGQIEISDGLTIDGGGQITVSGDGDGDDAAFIGNVTDVPASGAGALDNNSRLFNGSADLTFAGLTLTGGRTTGVDEAGGAVFTTGSVTITDSVIAGNSTVNDGAAGGGIYAGGDLIVENSTISRNLSYGAVADGGGLFALGDVMISNSTITGNFAASGDALGGGVASEGDITVSNSIILGNYNPGTYAKELIELTGGTGDTLITVEGTNIIGVDIEAFDAGSAVEPGSSGTAENADPAQVFDRLVNSNVVIHGELGLNGGIGPSVGLLNDVNNPALDAITQGGVDGRGLARGVDLVAVDNGGTSDIGAFELQLQPPTAATITSPNQFTVSENDAIAGDVEADDPVQSEGDGLIYSIIAGADAALFSINSTTGVFSFTTPPDFETPGDADGDNVYELTVQVRDAGAIGDSQAITVTVTNGNDAPAATPGQVTGDEDTVITGTVAATDGDGDDLTFDLSQGPQNGSVTVDPDGAFTFTPDPDFFGQDSFTFTVTDGQQTDIGTVDLTVIDVFDPDVPSPAGDELFGTPGSDTINGFGGDDTILGLAENDLLIGGIGADSVGGGIGDDTLRGNGGADTLNGNSGADDIRGGGGADDIRGGGGADNILGNTGNDIIRGNGGADNILAGTGDDTVRAGSGADTVDGGGGADSLEGGGGADVLIGRGGDDILRGNTGADTFQFNETDVNDTILDFTQGRDQIEILSGAASFDDLIFTQDGVDVLVGFGAGQVRVVTDDVAAFDEDDFIF